MNASAFDPNIFLDAQQTEVNEKRPLIPVDNPADSGGYYTAVIGEITTKSGTIGKGDRIGQPWASMNVPLKLQLPPEVQSIGLPPEFQITDAVFLDLTPEGQLDNSKGKNRGQKMYRDATGLNNPGEAFAWRMLQGRIVKVKLKHEPYNDSFNERVAMVVGG